MKQRQQEKEEDFQVLTLTSFSIYFFFFYEGASVALLLNVRLLRALTTPLPWEWTKCWGCSLKFGVLPVLIATDVFMFSSALSLHLPLVFDPVWQRHKGSWQEHTASLANCGDVDKLWTYQGQKKRLFFLNICSSTPMDGGHFVITHFCSRRALSVGKC